MTQTVDDFLTHYGIKGMRWGVTRKVGKNGRVEREPESADSAKTRANVARSKTSGVQALSNDELREVNTRLQLERQFNQLSTEASGYQRGKKTVNEILSVGDMMNRVYKLGTTGIGRDILGAAAEAASPRPLGEDRQLTG